MSYAIPEQIESERLILRTFREDDHAALHVLYSDEECVRYTFQRTLTEGESWRALASVIGHWQLRGYGPYALEEKASGDVLGIAGLWFPHDWPEPEIKWALARSYWGQGYASEAARAVRSMAAEHLPEITLISLILAANSNSCRLAEAVGATLEREIEFRGQRALIYRHRAPGSGEPPH